jgi:hypothetical protein
MLRSWLHLSCLSLTAWSHIAPPLVLLGVCEAEDLKQRWVPRSPIRREGHLLPVRSSASPLSQI